jgi:cation:H+ antiporter
MLWPTVSVVVGIALTVLSADKFVEGASSLADRLGMSHFLIGLTIVSIGTSAPELLVAALAALEGSPSLALGNALGSNITNIALVLGATACFYPLLVPGPLIRRELPMLVVVCVAVCALALRGNYDVLAGIIFLITLPILLYRLFQDESEVIEDIEIADHTLGGAILLTVAGLAVLLGSSKALVWGATELALQFGISELIIGLTIVAIGTSLPELAASLASAIRGKPDMALGTVIGSNLFNFLGVIGIAAVIAPFAIEADVMTRDLPWTLGLTVLLWGLARFGRDGILTRWHGLLLLLLYVGYLWHVSATIVPNS